MKTKLILITASILSLLACNNEDSVESLNYEDSAYGVVGRWYSESNVDDPLFNMYAEYVFTADGVIYADEYRKINGFRRDSIQGKYSVKNGNITTEFGINQGGQSTSSLEVTDGLTFSASFHRFSEDYTLTFHRVVGEILLTVDSTVNVKDRIQENIEAYTAQAVEIKGYEMSDEAIASIDENGLLKAKLIGVTFLKVETSAGMAMLKVSISDKNNLWNDFSQALGKNFDEVECLFGKHYAFRNDTMFRYHYDSHYINSVDIYRFESLADSIVITFQPAIDSAIILNYLKHNYVSVDTLKRWYTNDSNFLLATFSAKYLPIEHKIIFTCFDPKWDDRIQDFGLTFNDLKDKYGDYRTQVNGQQVTYYNLKNDFVDLITYFIDSKIGVNEYQIIVNENIPIPMIEDYMKRKFLFKSYSRPFVKNVRINGEEMFIWVSIGDKKNSLRYHFEENKSVKQ